LTSGGRIGEPPEGVSLGGGAVGLVASGLTSAERIGEPPEGVSLGGGAVGLVASGLTSAERIGEPPEGVSLGGGGRLGSGFEERVGMVTPRAGVKMGGAAPPGGGVFRVITGALVAAATFLAEATARAPASTAAGLVKTPARAFPEGASPADASARALPELPSLSG